MKNSFKCLLWVLGITGIIAVRWTVYFYFLGEVPVTKEIVTMSRWWDLLGGPISVTLFIVLKKSFDGVLSLSFKDLSLFFLTGIFLSVFAFGLVFSGLVPGICYGIFSIGLAILAIILILLTSLLIELCGC